MGAWSEYAVKGDYYKLSLCLGKVCPTQEPTVMSKYFLRMIKKNDNR